MDGQNGANGPKPALLLVELQRERGEPDPGRIPYLSLEWDSRVLGKGTPLGSRRHFAPSLPRPRSPLDQAAYNLESPETLGKDLHCAVNPPNTNGRPQKVEESVIAP